MLTVFAGLISPDLLAGFFRVTINLPAICWQKGFTMPKSVEQWVAQHEARLSDASPVDEMDHKVTLRIPLTTYVRLRMIAEKYGYTPTKCGQELFEAGIHEAYDALPFDDDTFRAYLEDEI
jgi:predicted DNA-binding protein